MSDSESDITETEESIQISKVLESLQSGAVEAIESGDFLSYSTLIDIYLTDNKFSNDEKEQILATLLQILTDLDDSLTYEIGWDLPAVLISSIDLDWLFEGTVREAPFLYNIIKIFEALALKGNPKELLLKSCEIFSVIKASDIETESDDPLVKQKFFDVKLYCLLHLIDSSLKRIETIYPSKFLSMATTSFINLLYNNRESTLTDLVFALRRFYGFARDYTRLTAPKSEGFTKEELENIDKDEQYLQGKLLTSFATNAISTCVLKNSYLLGHDHFGLLQNKDRKGPEFTVDTTILGRFVELMLSFDVDLEQEFRTFITDSYELLKIDYSQPDDDITAEIFEKCVVDYQKTLDHTITNSDAKEIKNSKVGIITLYTYNIAATQAYANTNVSFYDVVVLTLRCTVPALINRKFINVGLMDICSFWAWNGIYNSKRFAVEISSIPKAIITIYYQCILFFCAITRQYPKVRYSMLTILTKVLALSPEETAYAFLTDSLTSCPYQHVKPALVVILKELLTRGSGVNGLGLDKLVIADKDETSTTTVSEATEKEGTKVTDTETYESTRATEVKAPATEVKAPATEIKAPATEVKVPTEDETKPTGNESEANAKVSEPESTGTKQNESKGASNNPTTPPPALPRRTTAHNVYHKLTTSKFTDIVHLVEANVEETFLLNEDVLSIDPQLFSTLAAYLNLFVAIRREPVVISRQAELDKLIRDIELNIAQIKGKYEGEDKPFEYNAAGLLEIAIERIKGQD